MNNLDRESKKRESNCRTTGKMPAKISGINKKQIEQAMTKDEIFGETSALSYCWDSPFCLFLLFWANYVFDVPMKESSDLIKDINHSEMVFEKQRSMGNGLRLYGTR